MNQNNESNGISFREDATITVYHGDEMVSQLEPAPAKHTPGPWEHMPAISSDRNATRLEQTHWIKGPETDSSLCTSICDIAIWDTMERQIANARLIAAAPDLLEALKDVMSEIQAIIDDGTLRESDVKNHTSIIKANSAIAKATQE